MAPARKRRAAPGKSPKRRWFGRLLRIGFLSTLVLAALGTGYLIYIDRTITHTFEGRRWSVPAVVYARPLEVFPGADLSLEQARHELQRLGYRQASHTRHPGVFKRQGDELIVHLRAFRFMERYRESQVVHLHFGPQGGVERQRLAQITDADTRPIAIIRLDPVVIGSFFPSHGEDRLVLRPEEVPELLTESLKAVEDQHFDSHLGFDPRGIARAMWVNLRAGEFQQGGSTLTQQLVKSYFLDNRRTLTRKLRELAMAIILELRFPKTDLLNAYVNEIYLGQAGRRAVHGFGLGAQFYFNKPLSELSVGEIATLIAVIRGPSYYNPFLHAERARERRNLVLGKMAQSGLITADTASEFAAEPLAVVRGTRRGGGYYPAFMDLVRRNLDSQYADEDLASQGLRIFTTLDPRAQDALERSAAETLTDLETRRELPSGELQAAAVSVDVQTGEVNALLGSRDAGVDGFNRALAAERPVGSLIKPVIYLLALEHGMHLASPLLDTPVSLDLPGDNRWEPRNFDGEPHGQVPLVRGLGDSLNLATVNLGLTLGVDRVADRLSTLIPHAVHNRYPSLLLGAEAMSPLEVTSLYGAFASGGYYMAPKAVIAVLDETGAPVSQHPFQLEQRIATEPAQDMLQALSLVMRRGTGKTSRFARAGIAGKTGTSDDYRDSWFTGFDDQRLATVWIGYDDNRPTGLTGAAGALRLWDDYMARLGVMPISVMPESTLVTIDYDTGYLSAEHCGPVVQIPVPADAILQSAPGCAINSRGFKDRVRSWFRRSSFTP